MTEKFLVRVIHGSHLFGTNTEASDMDIKSVVQPSVEDILLGNVNWSRAVGADDSRANTKDDVDDERHDLKRFMQLITTGQPMALEILFAPDQFHVGETHPIWKELQNNSNLLISRQSQKFLGYCRQQAMSHGLKGERLDAAEKVQEIVNRLVAKEGPRKILKDYLDMIVTEVKSPHVSEVFRTTVDGKKLSHLKISNKLAAATVELKEVKDICDNVVQNYGRRARMAQEGQGKDWKALSHALRIGYEALELFETSFITFPRPEAAYLLDVKLGKVDPDVVGNEIEELLYKVEDASANSSLPENPDIDFMNDLIIQTYGNAVFEAFALNKEYSEDDHFSLTV